MEIFLCLFLKQYLMVTVFPNVIKQRNEDIIIAQDVTDNRYGNIEYNNENNIAINKEVEVMLDKIKDNDVNRLMGWAIHKIQINIENKYYEEELCEKKQKQLELELKILDNMVVKEIDIIHNIKYIQSYYPTDDAIRNNGNLTLISPLFVMVFAKMLLVINDNFQYLMKYTNEMIPTNEEIKKFVCKCKEIYLMQYYESICKILVRHFCLSDGGLRSLCQHACKLG